MADGDVLQIVAGHQAFAASSGAAQTITLIGPFGIDFDDADIGNGIGLTDLAAGQLVLTNWVFVTTPFDGSAKISVAIGDPAGGTYFIGYYIGDNSSSVLPGLAVAATVDPGTDDLTENIPHPALVTDVQQLVVWVDGGPFSAGHADIYALIVTPA